MQAYLPRPMLLLTSTLIAILFGLFLTSCQTEDPPAAETILRLTLDDSLSRYDYVVITIVDPQNMSHVLERVWSGKLPAPSQIPGYALTAAKGKDFIVRVAGYAAEGQLFLETLIYYVGGIRSVVHNTVPAYTPRFALKTLSLSAGKIAPNLTKDSTQYSAILPLGTTSVTLKAEAFFSGAQVMVKNKILLPDSSSKPIFVGTSADTISILVTDASQGTSYTREYRLILHPTIPSLVLLSGIEPSVGVLDPPFSSGTVFYSLLIPFNSPSVSFVLHLNDPRTMTMNYNGTTIIDGVSSPPMSLDPGISNIATIEVNRGNERNYYQVTVERARN